MGALKLEESSKALAHVVDILGNVRGRDQPIMLVRNAIDLISYLDDKDITSEKTVFFDPFCKAGEVLLACATYRTMLKRNTKNKVVPVELIQKDMFTSGRYFGLAPDERHYRLSMRTFLGSSNSYKKEYQKIFKNGAYLSEKDGRLDEDRFNKELTLMLEYIKENASGERIIAIGNPPYHEEDEGESTGSGPIYQHFINQVIESGEIDEFIFVIPTKWFVLDAKGLGAFRKKILTSKKIKTLRYFEKAEEVFPSVQVKGGVCFLHWVKEYNGNVRFITNQSSSIRDLNKYDKIPDDLGGEEILDKIFDNWKGDTVSKLVYSRNPFGLATNHFDKNKELKKNSSNAIACYTQKQEIKWANRKDIKQNHDIIDMYKVAVPKGYGKGMKRCTMPVHKYFLMKKGEITTDTHIILGSFAKKSQAERFMNYLKTDFARYLLGLRKLTQDVSQDRWNWIPLVDLSKDWDDEKLFKFFKINQAQAEHIRTKIKEWA